MNNSSTRYVTNIEITIRLKFVPFIINQDQIARKYFYFFFDQADEKELCIARWIK